jgi:hypothetical protein
MVRLVNEPGLYARLTANAVLSAARFGWTGFVEQLDDVFEHDVFADASAHWVNEGDTQAVGEL